MNLPRLYPILDTESLARRNCEILTAAEAMLGGGATLLQLRHKGHFSRAMFDQTGQVAALCRKAGARFVMNDRADIALMLQAGLHLGQDDLPPADARRLLGPEAMIGFSTHNEAQIAAGASEPVDYLAFGPVFSTRSKANPDPVAGLEGLRKVRQLISRPLVAIGGITRASAVEVLAAGATSVAVIGDLLTDTCSYLTLRERMEEWQRIVAR